MLFRSPPPPSIASTDRLPPPTPFNALTLTGYSDRYLSGSDLPSSGSNSEALVVSALQGCFVDLTSDGAGAAGEPQISTFYLYSLKDSIVVLLPVLGSIMVHDCEGCTFLLGAHQVRRALLKAVDYELIPFAVPHARLKPLLRISPNRQQPNYRVLALADLWPLSFLPLGQ